MHIVPTVGPFIDGRLQPSLDEAQIKVVCPSTGKPLMAIPAGCESDVEHAVTSARMAVDDGRWSELAPSDRKCALHHFADLIGQNCTELDALDAAEMGKPVREAFCNASAAASLMRFYAEALDKATGDVYSSDKHSFVTQRRVPRGLVAAIVPWNFPTFNAILKLAPALAAGNCVVLKPSELASRSSLRLAELAVQSGIPSGVFNVVPGLGRTVGRALGMHCSVDMLTFTGSSEVGKLMLQYAGRSNMKTVMTECGGKSPQIVFGDGIDLDTAAKTIAQELLTNQGQICSVGTRLLVQPAIEAELIDRIAARFKEVVIGDPLDLATTFGPLVSAKQCGRVMRYIDSAAAEGAQLVIGGRRALPETGGYFVEPTMFRGVSPAARIAQEEIFGPVLSVIPFRDEAEAISIANGTMYGLAACVWTANLTTGIRMAKGLRSSVLVNSAPPQGEGAGHSYSSEPFGQSGLGTEGGVAGMESYLRRQLVWFNHG